ncbi:MAG: MBL fold metallo-hydrolase [Ardenticatenaceae bacterium]|nr:MBL fold metallo-hydrolase [Ardenticatenaceae bacterium]
MRLQQINQNLWQGTRMWLMNCYFVREADGLTVVDTLMPGSGRAIVEAADKIGLPLKRLVLTHAHADHAGSVDEVAEMVPGIEVAYGQRSAEFLRGETGLKAGEAPSKLRGSYVTVDKAADTLLQDGDLFGSLRVVASPGHTPDHLAFFDERDRALIAGDAFQTQGGIAVAGVFRLGFPLPALATWDKPTALSSARKLFDLNPNYLAVGHGKVLKQPAALMGQAINTAEQKFNG